MRIKFYGVRGSIPVPGPGTARYGGNTSCIELDVNPESHFILDAGTGIRELGHDLLVRNKGKQVMSSLFITHTHWDHIHGFPFFGPNFVPTTVLDVYGPFHFDKKLEEVFALQMDYSYFPISTKQLLSNISYHDLNETQFSLGDVRITTKIMNHPIICLGYRFEYQGKTVVYTGDNEPYYDVLSDPDQSDEERQENEAIIEESNLRTVQFVQDADLLIADSQYTPEEYPQHVGWGHSTWMDSITMARKAGVKKLVLFHHEVTRRDEEMDQFYQSALRYAREQAPGIAVEIAREGLEIVV